MGSGQDDPRSRTEVRLQGGERVLLRPIHASDDRALAAAFQRLGADSRYKRFLTAKPRLTQAERTYLTNVDHHDHEAIVAIAPEDGELAGEARFIRLAERPNTAEIAVTVDDSWQGCGLGSALLDRLSRRAAEEAISCFTAEVLTANTAMLELLRRLGDVTTAPSDGRIVVTHVELPPQHTPSRLRRADG